MLKMAQFRHKEVDNLIHRVNEYALRYKFYWTKPIVEFYIEKDCIRYIDADDEDSSYLSTETVATYNNLEQAISHFQKLAYTERCS
jgi:hypothetical protein